VLISSRIVRLGGLAMTVGMIGGTFAGVATASAATKAVNPKTVNVKHASLKTLRTLAAKDHMGRTLAKHKATSVSPSAVPLLHVGTSAGANVSAAATSSVVYGMDVSSFQGNVAWSTMKSRGAHFAYIKATEGNYYTNPFFAQQYVGSFNVGMVRGAYAFGIPNKSGGANQADYLLAHGGKWSADGKTLPAALDIEYNPYSGGECYGLSQASMRSWITAFMNEYHAKTTRWPVIYSTNDWWRTCTGTVNFTASKSPFWIARYASSAGTLPVGYGFYTIWQYASSGTFAGDQDVFNGAQSRLVALANNT
jgi:GH25 family lysozyme M1 (1,4-beta-N-acetylmuramidase)